MADEENNSVGRPSDFKPEYVEQAFRLCLLGMNDKELATYFQTSEVTLNAWKQRHPEFLKSVIDGREEADGKVVAAFYKRACGIEYQETTYEKIHSDQGIITEEGISTEAYKKKVVHKYALPDPGAAYNWLLNRQREKWKNKTEIDHTSGGKPIPSVLNLSNGTNFSID
jgi:hypothetical protein